MYRRYFEGKGQCSVYSARRQGRERKGNSAYTKGAEGRKEARLRVLCWILIGWSSLVDRNIRAGNKEELYIYIRIVVCVAKGYIYIYLSRRKKPSGLDPDEYQMIMASYQIWSSKREVKGWEGQLEDGTERQTRHNSILYICRVCGYLGGANQKRLWDYYIWSRIYGFCRLAGKMKGENDGEGNRRRWRHTWSYIYIESILRHMRWIYRIGR